MREYIWSHENVLVIAVTDSGVRIQLKLRILITITITFVLTRDK